MPSGNPPLVPLEEPTKASSPSPPPLPSTTLSVVCSLLFIFFLLSSHVSQLVFFLHKRISSPHTSSFATASSAESSSSSISQMSNCITFACYSVLCIYLWMASSSHDHTGGTTYLLSFGSSDYVISRFHPSLVVFSSKWVLYVQLVGVHICLVLFLIYQCSVCRSSSSSRQKISSSSSFADTPPQSPYAASSFVNNLYPPSPPPPSASYIPPPPPHILFKAARLYLIVGFFSSLLVLAISAVAAAAGWISWVGSEKTTMSFALLAGLVALWLWMSQHVGQLLTNWRTRSSHGKLWFSYLLECLAYLCVFVHCTFQSICTSGSSCSRLLLPLPVTSLLFCVPCILLLMQHLLLYHRHAVFSRADIAVVRYLPVTSKSHDRDDVVMSSDEKRSDGSTSPPPSSSSQMRRAKLADVLATKGSRVFRAAKPKGKKKEQQRAEEDRWTSRREEEAGREEKHLEMVSMGEGECYTD
eukprot:GHVS01104925.1.p1 GENE.GHVS01104925.1~~GHVS01104925.1.p1  ORF type:complete len:514 (-),score=175.32 GHVS01104925.1:188-1597(-)